MRVILCPPHLASLRDSSVKALCHKNLKMYEKRQVIIAAAIFAFHEASVAVALGCAGLAMLVYGAKDGTDVAFTGFAALGISLASIFSGYIFKVAGKSIGFIIGSLFIIACGLTGIIAILSKDHTVLFIVSALFLGIGKGLLAKIRFVASELSAPDRESQDEAFTIILSGGILSGVFGPMMTPLMETSIPAHIYMGNFVMVIGLGFAALCSVAFGLKWLPPQATHRLSSISDKRVEGGKISEGDDACRESQVVRYTSDIVLSSHFLLGVALTSTSNSLMLLIVGSIGQEMVDFQGMSVFSASIAVTLCFFTRYAPGLLSGKYLKRYGVWRGTVIAIISNIISFILVYIACLVPGMTFLFYPGTFFVGLGWHFGFTSGNLMITRVTRRREGRRNLQVQAVHDTILFGVSGVVVIFASQFENITHDAYRNLILTFGLFLIIIFAAASLMAYSKGYTSMDDDANNSKQGHSEESDGDFDVEFESFRASCFDADGSAYTRDRESLEESHASSVKIEESLNPVIVEAKSSRARVSNTIIRTSEIHEI